MPKRKTTDDISMNDYAPEGGGGNDGGTVKPPGETGSFTREELLGTKEKTYSSADGTMEGTAVEEEPTEPGAGERPPNETGSWTVEELYPQKKAQSA